jgi:hypothetical protein
MYRIQIFVTFFIHSDIKVGNVRKNYISLKLLLNFSKEVQLNYDWFFYTTIVFSNFDDRLLFVSILFFGVILTLPCHTYCLVRGVASGNKKLQRNISPPPRLCQHGLKFFFYNIWQQKFTKNHPVLKVKWLSP